MKHPSPNDYTTTVSKSIHNLEDIWAQLLNIRNSYNIDVPVYDFLIYLLKEKNHKSYAEIKDLLGLKSRGIVQYKVNKIKKLLKDI